MNHRHGNRTFADGRSHPRDASGPDVAYSEYFWEAGFEHLRRAGKGANPDSGLIHQLAADYVR